MELGDVVNRVFSGNQGFDACIGERVEESTAQGIVLDVRSRSSVDIFWIGM